MADKGGGDLTVAEAQRYRTGHSASTFTTPPKKLSKEGFLDWVRYSVVNEANQLDIQ
jgi:hypothetical protein